MNMRSWRSGLILLGFALLVTTQTGCPQLEEIIDELDLDDIELKIGGAVDVIQQPATVVVPDGIEVILAPDVVIIDDIRQDIVIAELPDVTILGFENLTGFDGYYEFYAEDELQGVFVLDGETLLLEYPCLADVELISETYFDPLTGLEEDSFDIFDAFFTNPLDFQCGDAFIFTFDADGIIAGAELLEF